MKSGISREISPTDRATDIGGDLVRGLGGRGRRISAEIFFCRLQNVKFGGTAGGLTVFVNFNIYSMDFVYI